MYKRHSLPMNVANALQNILFVFLSFFLFCLFFSNWEFFHFGFLTLSRHTSLCAVMGCHSYIHSIWRWFPSKEVQLYKNISFHQHCTLLLHSACSTIKDNYRKKHVSCLLCLSGIYQTKPCGLGGTHFKAFQLFQIYS